MVIWYCTLLQVLAMPCLARQRRLLGAVSLRRGMLYRMKTLTALRANANGLREVKNGISKALLINGLAVYVEERVQSKEKSS